MSNDTTIFAVWIEGGEIKELAILCQELEGSDGSTQWRPLDGNDKVPIGEDLILNKAFAHLPIYYTDPSDREKAVRMCVGAYTKSCQDKRYLEKESLLSTQMRMKMYEDMIEEIGGKMDSALSQPLPQP